MASVRLTNCGFANRGIFEERRHIPCGWHAIAALIISIINMQRYFLQYRYESPPLCSVLSQINYWKTLTSYRFVSQVHFNVILQTKSQSFPSRFSNAL